MSLGPFELLGAEPTNPYGHFEAVPFHKLNRQIQSLAHGFADDLPDSPEVLAHFCETRGQWDVDTHIPDEFLAEGRALVRTLVDSGEVSGFKDPRTVLTWPFWQRVFAGFEDVRVIPVGLIRSPHEIAMSLVTRRGGWRGYWTSLDVIAVHFHRQKQILDAAPDGIPCLCFGSPSYLKTLEIAVRQAGLCWDAPAVLELFDHSAVHQRPAAIAHQAQELFESMCGEGASPCEPETSRARQEKDARFLEGLRLDQWKINETKVSQARDEARTLSVHAGELLSTRNARCSRDRLAEVQGQLAEAERHRQSLQSQLIDAERRIIEGAGA